MDLRFFCCWFGFGLGFLWGKESGFGDFGLFFFFYCCFVFGFVLGFIFSMEAQILFNESSGLCFCGISSELSFSDTRAQCIH